MMVQREKYKGLCAQRSVRQERTPRPDSLLQFQESLKNGQTNAKAEMKKGNTENTYSNCNCKTEGLYVIALILITGCLLCFTLVLVFDMPELATVPMKCKPEYSFENIKERLYKKTKIIMQPEESSINK